MKTKLSSDLKIKLSYAPDEHLLSAWMRHNFRCGFAYFSFERCLDYWGLPIQHLKAQRISGNILNKIIAQVTNNDIDRLPVLLEITNLRLWQLSEGYTDDLSMLENLMPRANLENNEFVFSTSWHLCTKCIDEERERLGYCYWHQSHQLPSITHCLKHRIPLKTHKSLGSINRLALPNSYLKEDMVAYQHCNELLEWSQFIDKINSSLTLDASLPEKLRHLIKHQLNLPDLGKYNDKVRYQKITDKMFADVGEVLTQHLFKKIRGKNKNILWIVFSGRQTRQSILSPVYWLIILFWLKDELAI
jgi:hypothetical protein